MFSKYKLNTTEANLTTKWTRRPLLKLAVHDRRIAVGFIRVIFFVLIGKLAGALKEMAVAWKYGSSATVDSYVFVFNLVSWPIAVWFSILTAVLVPIVANLRHAGPVAVACFQKELLGLTLALGMLTGLAFYWGLPLALQNGWTGLTGPVLSKAAEATRILALIVPLGIGISFLSAWLMACGKHRNTLLEALPSLTILLFLLMPTSWIGAPLLIGTLIGYAVQLVALGTLSEKGSRAPLPSLAFSSPAWTGFSRGIAVLAVGQAVMSLATIVDQFFAATLSPGAIASLSYANRILALVTGMGATAIMRATLPVLSDMRLSGNAEVLGMAMRWSKWMFLAGLTTLAIGWALTLPMVSLMFERGSFTAKDSKAVADILAWALTQVPFYFSSIVLSAALSSLGRFRMVALGSAINFIAKLAFSFLLVDKYKIHGLVIANSGMYLVSMAFLTGAIYREVKREKAGSHPRIFA